MQSGQKCVGVSVCDCVSIPVCVSVSAFRKTVLWECRLCPVAVFDWEELSQTVDKSGPSRQGRSAIRGWRRGQVSQLLLR